MQTVTVDLSDQFSPITSQLFKSYVNLLQEMDRFACATGVHYRQRNTTYQSSRSLYREALVYRSFRLCCTQKYCPSFIFVSAKGECLRVTSYDMHHNHDIRLSEVANSSGGVVGGICNPYRAECKGGDLVSLPHSNSLNYHNLANHTSLFKRHILNATYESFDCIRSRLNEFEQQTGSSFVIRVSQRIPSTWTNAEQLKYKRVTFGCVQGGRNSSLRRVGSYQVGCQARMTFNAINNRLVPTKVFLVHNHRVKHGKAHPKPLGLPAPSTQQTCSHPIITQVAPGSPSLINQLNGMRGLEVSYDYFRQFCADANVSENSPTSQSQLPSTDLSEHLRRTQLMAIVDPVFERIRRMFFHGTTEWVEAAVTEVLQLEQRLQGTGILEADRKLVSKGKGCLQECATPTIVTTVKQQHPDRTPDLEQTLSIPFLNG